MAPSSSSRGCFGCVSCFRFILSSALHFLPQSWAHLAQKTTGWAQLNTSIPKPSDPCYFSSLLKITSLLCTIKKMLNFYTYPSHFDETIDSLCSLVAYTCFLEHQLRSDIFYCLQKASTLSYLPPILNLSTFTHFTIGENIHSAWIGRFWAHCRHRMHNCADLHYLSLPSRIR